MGGQSYIGLNLKGVPLSHGFIDFVEPTDNGNGTITIPTMHLQINDAANFAGNIKTITIAGTTTTLGGALDLVDALVTPGAMNYVCVNYNSGSPQWVIQSTNINVNNGQIIPYVSVYREGTVLNWVDWWNQGLGAADKVVDRLVRTQRVAYESGLAIAVNGSLQLQIDSGYSWHGTYRKTHPIFNYGDSIKHWYRTGINTWANQTVTTLNNSQYNDPTVGLVTLTNNNRWVVNWIYRSYGVSNKTVLILGLEYASYAEAAAELEPLRPPSNQNLGLLVGRAIFQKSSTSPTVLSAFATQIGASQASNHEQLGGILGGDGVNNHYHLAYFDTIAAAQAITSWTDNSSIIYIRDTNDLYVYKSNPSLTADGVFILTTGVGGTSRFVSIQNAGIRFSGGTTFQFGTTNPSLVATSAFKGSMYFKTDTPSVYMKTDDGSSTNWTLLNDHETLSSLSGGSVSNHYHIGYIDTIANLKLINTMGTGSIFYCAATREIYEYLANPGLTADDVFVITTANGGNTRWVSKSWSMIPGSTDPSVTATSAPIGARYTQSSNGQIWIKQDAGSTTNWKPIDFTKYNPGFYSGFYDTTNVALSFSGNIFTITGNRTVFCQGRPFYKTGSETSDFTGIAKNMYWLYYNASGVLTRSTTVNFETDAIVAAVYWNGSAAVAGAFECHKPTEPEDHYWKHLTFGMRYANGLGITYSALTGNTAPSDDSNTTIILAGGLLLDEDIDVDVTHTTTPTTRWQQDLGTAPLDGASMGDAAKLSLYYYNSATSTFVRTTVSDRVPFLYSGVNGPPQWINSGTPSNPTDQYYVVYFIFGSTLSNAFIPGQVSECIFSRPYSAQFQTLAAAQAVDWTSLVWSSFPSADTKPLYKIIYQYRSTYTNATHRCVIREVADYRSQNSTATAGTVATDHQALSNRTATAAHPSSSIEYTPTTGTNWDVSTDPINVLEGLDKIASQGVVKTQTMNTVFAGPTSGAAALPAFRALIAEDIATGTATSGYVPVSAGAGVAPVWTVMGSAPVGTVVMNAAAALPSGWLNCDGSEVSKTTYAALWTAFGGHVFGTPADPTNNFLLPNFAGRSPMGNGTISGGSLTRVFGTNYGGENVATSVSVGNHTFTNPTVAAHGHGFTLTAAGQAFSTNTASTSTDHTHTTGGRANASAFASNALFGCVSSGSVNDVSTGGQSANATHTHSLSGTASSSSVSGSVGPNTNGDSTITTSGGAVSAHSVTNTAIDPTHPVITIKFIIKH